MWSFSRLYVLYVNVRYFMGLTTFIYSVSNAYWVPIIRNHIGYTHRAVKMFFAERFSIFGLVKSRLSQSSHQSLWIVSARLLSLLVLTLFQNYCSAFAYFSLHSGASYSRFQMVILLTLIILEITFFLLNNYELSIILEINQIVLVRSSILD